MTEEWRSIPGALQYEISNRGRLRRNSKEIRGCIGGAGYRKTAIKMDGRIKYVTFHTLVAITFLGPRQHGFQVDHIDCDRGNNVLSNLRYITQAENVRRPFLMGHGAVGERHGRYTKPEKSARGERVNTSKLGADDVRKIRQRHDAGEQGRVLARQFGVSTSNISNIVNRRSWRHVV